MRLGMFAISVLTVLASGTALAVDPPKLSKSFRLPSNRTFVNPGETTTLVFTVTNPNPTGLTGIGFTDVLPPGLVVATPNGLRNSCGGVANAASGGSVIDLASGALGAAGLTAPNTCTISVNISAQTLGNKLNATTPVLSTEGGAGLPAVASLLVAHTLWAGYAANLNIGDSNLNMTSAGTQATTTGGLATICANVYVFSPDEQLISCCACPLTTSELARLSARDDLIGNTLTPAVPNSILVKMVATHGSVCSAANVADPIIALGLVPWMTTLHALPTTPATYGTTEMALVPAPLSAAELSRITSFCGFIQANGSGYGICRRCRPGALGADKR